MYVNCAGTICTVCQLCMSIVQGQYVLYVNCAGAICTVCQLYRDNMCCMSIVQGQYGTLSMMLVLVLYVIAN